MGGRGKEFKCRVNVRWTGVRFGSEFSLSGTEVEWIVTNCYDCALPSSTTRRPVHDFRLCASSIKFGVDSRRLTAGAFKYLGELNRATVCHHPKKQLL